ncbi:type 2 lanthipeptide synthetase LanM family protein [Rossellomorea aquimaris]|nr:type 2 lanthipeptide synthetase LanM family protein [Rossellomorea aquimaris]
MLKNGYRALRVDERYYIIQNFIDEIELNEDSLMNWRKEMSLLTNEDFEEMLKVNGYDKVLFSQAVSANPEKRLLEHYHNYVYNSEWYKQFSEVLDLTSSIKLDEEKYQNFFIVLRPFIQYAEKEMNRMFEQESVAAILEKSVLEKLLLQFSINILTIAQKSIILELNIAREQGLLQGETSEERYQFFIDSFKEERSLISFYEKYIVLTRLLVDLTNHFLTNLQTMLNRILDSKEEIIRSFQFDELLITEIDLGQGDTHSKGNTVTSLTLKCGSKLLYKPKNLYVARLYNLFVDRINQNETMFDLKTIEGLYYDSHAFEKYLEYEGCDNEQEVEGYYQRFGQILGILYLLNASDIHLENLVASGKYPMVVDLETLFQQPIIASYDIDIIKRIQQEMFNNVTATMLLPIDFGDSSDREDLYGLDLSALNGRGGKLKKKVLQPINLKTDQMRYDYKEVSTEGGKNIPFLKETETPVYYMDYSESIIKGFQRTCQFFIEKNIAEDIKRECWTNKDDYIIRTIFRDTSQYANILNHSNHPDLLQDMLDRDKVLENMWSFPFEKKVIIKNEVEDMQVNDIPIFFSNLVTGQTFNSRMEEIGNTQEDKGIDLFLQKSEKISKEEIDKQTSIIQAALGKYPSLDREAVQLSVSNDDEQPFLQAAVQIADTLIDSSISSEDSITWLTVNPVGENGWSVNQTNSDFYDGLTGVHLFFQKLFEVTRDEKYKDYAARILNTVKYSGRRNEFGLNSGFAGLVHSCSYINRRAQSQEFRTSLEDQLKFLESNKLDLTSDDYLNGAPSLINSALKAYETHRDPMYLNLAIQYAEKYINTFDPERQMSKKGFGHGPLSIAYVFYKLWHTTNNKRYLKTAKQYQQKINLSELKSTEGMTLSWCNGLLGIALADMEISKIVDEPVEKDFSLPSMKDDGLCHGNMSRSEYYLKLYQHTGKEEYLIQARDIAKEVIENARTHGGFRLRATKGYRSIGLFTGLAGIGYQLIRIHNPNKAPSLLV